MRETVADLATTRKHFSSRHGGLLPGSALRYVAGMATRSRTGMRPKKAKRAEGRPKKAPRPADVVPVYKGRIPYLYVREHMEDRGVEVSYLVEQLGMHEKAVYKAIKPANRSRIWKDIRPWSEALGLEAWQDLLRPPGKPSVDARIDSIPEEFQEVIMRAVGKPKG